MAQRGNGGIIGPANVPTTLKASGVWTAEEQLLAQSNNRWPNNLVQRSLRFNSADSAYLNRTPASAGNRKTWTWSAWVKRSAIGSEQAIFARSNTAGNIHTGVIFNAANKLRFFSNASVLDLETAQVFRDTSAWYHILVVLDTTQATSSNRAKIYLNGNGFGLGRVISVSEPRSVNFDENGLKFTLLNSIGPTAKSAEPAVEQLFIKPEFDFKEDIELERKLYVLRGSPERGKIAPHYP